jgi:transposase-like protein
LRGEELYTAIFKLEFVDFVKEKGNCEAARKFNVGETSIREWRKEEPVIKYNKLYFTFHALFLYL